MDLTRERKEYIDGLDIRSLLSEIRLSPLGDPWFQGETGHYWMKRYAKLRDADPEAHVSASKSIGWQR